MIAVTSPSLWYMTRAAGIVALVLLTGSVVLGMLTSARVSTKRWPRFALGDLHRRLSLMAMVFVAIHVLTTVVDTFVPIGFLPAVVPFASHYKTLWVTLGTVAFDLLLAVTLTSLLRGHISAGAWRAVHWAAYLSWPVAMIHAVEIGTDMRFLWADIIIAACCIAVMLTFGWRVVGRPVRAGVGVAAPSDTAIQMVRQGRVQVATVTTPDSHRPRPPKP